VLGSMLGLFAAAAIIILTRRKTLP